MFQTQVISINGDFIMATQKLDCVIQMYILELFSYISQNLLIAECQSKINLSKVFVDTLHMHFTKGDPYAVIVKCNR